MGWLEQITKALAAGVDAYRAARDEQKKEIRARAEARDAELRARQAERAKKLAEDRTP